MRAHNHAHRRADAIAMRSFGRQSGMTKVSRRWSLPWWLQAFWQSLLHLAQWFKFSQMERYWNLHARRHHMQLILQSLFARSQTCSCFRAATSTRAQLQGWCQSEMGQASVEAALVLPTVLLLIALLVQPAMMLYTRCVMAHTAAETCRLMSTTASSDTIMSDARREYVLRRLSAVPDLPLFHVGGQEGWDVEMEGSTSSHQARVRITGRVRPLPVIGLLMAFGSAAQGDGIVVMTVEVKTQTRPDWVEGGYDEWRSGWAG